MRGWDNPYPLILTEYSRAKRRGLRQCAPDLAVLSLMFDSWRGRRVERRKGSDEQPLDAETRVQDFAHIATVQPHGTSPRATISRSLGAGAGGGPDVGTGAMPQKAPVPKQSAASESAERREQWQVCTSVHVAELCIEAVEVSFIKQ